MDKSIAEHLTDVIMEAPYGFSLGEKLFRLYPLSLGKMILLQRQLESMGVSEERISRSSVLEMVGVVMEHREQCLRLVAYMTCENKSQCFDAEYIKWVVGELSGATNEDVATLLIYYTASDHSAEIRKHYGIDEESEGMNAVLRVKSDKSSMSFGGKTILGALIDPACERYGWTVDYVVWGISYATLRLLMADKVNTVYLTDDERKRLPGKVLCKDEDVVMATKENMERIKSMDWR